MARGERERERGGIERVKREGKRVRKKQGKPPRGRGEMREGKKEEDKEKG